MKRSVYLLFICLFLLCLVAVVHAQISPENPDALGDKEKIENLTGNIPINEQGEIDKGKFTVWKTQAELRIEKINTWLETNASWLKAVFGIVPEISLLFAITLYIWLFFLTYIVINGYPFRLWIKDINYARIAGLGIFVALVVTKVSYYIALGILKLISLAWRQFVTNTMVGIIAGIIIVIIIVALAIFAPQLLEVMMKMIAEKQKEKKEERAREDLESEARIAKKREEGREAGRRIAGE